MKYTQIFFCRTITQWNMLEINYVLISRRALWLELILQDCKIRTVWNSLNRVLFAILPWCFWILSAPDCHCEPQTPEPHLLHCLPCVSASLHSPAEKSNSIIYGTLQMTSGHYSVDLLITDKFICSWQCVSLISGRDYDITLANNLQNTQFMSVFMF